MGIIRGGKLISDSELRAIAEEVTRAKLYDMGLKVIREYLIPNSPKDQNTYARGHRLRFTGQGFDVKMNFVNNVPHSKYVEEGRKPGKRPPFELILAWVRRHGLIDFYSVKTRTLKSGAKRRGGRRPLREAAEEAGQQFIARKIAAKIAFYGQPGRYLYRDLMKNNSVLIQRVKVEVKQGIMALLSA